MPSTTAGRSSADTPSAFRRLRGRRLSVRRRAARTVSGRAHRLGGKALGSMIKGSLPKSGRLPFCIWRRAKHAVFVALQRSRLAGQRHAGRFRHRHAFAPACRCDRDIAREAARAAERFCKADRHQSARFWHLVEVGDALGLREVVVQQPVLAFERRRRVGVERLMAVEQVSCAPAAGTSAHRG